MKERIILASQSPRRKQLLELINLDFDISVSTVPETTRAPLSPVQYAEEMSRRKARQVVSQKTNVLVIGADTVVVHEDEILEKPTDLDDARRMLSRLSNTSHSVITGVSMIAKYQNQPSMQSLTFHEITEVVFGQLTETEINEYVETGGPMDKAGSYGIQDDWGALFVKKIIGDYYNVVGFPLYTFYQNLKSFSPKHLPHAV